MDKREHLNKAEAIKAMLTGWFYDEPSDKQQQVMRLIDDYADAIHAYRLAELVEKMQGA